MQWTDVRMCVCDILHCNNSLKTRHCYTLGRHSISTIWVTTLKVFILQAAGLYRHPSMWLSILSPSLRSNPQHQHKALSLTILGPTSSADLTVGPPLLATMCNTKACFKVASASHLIFMVRLWIKNKLCCHLDNASCTASCWRALLLYKAILLTKRGSSHICKIRRLSFLGIHNYTHYYFLLGYLIRWATYLLPINTLLLPFRLLTWFFLWNLP